MVQRVGDGEYVMRQRGILMKTIHRSLLLRCLSDRECFCFSFFLSVFRSLCLYLSLSLSLCLSLSFTGHSPIFLRLVISRLCARGSARARARLCVCVFDCQLRWSRLLKVFGDNSAFSLLSWMCLYVCAHAVLL